MNEEVILEKIKVANHRLDDVEKKVDELIDFKFTVRSLSETVADLKVTVNELNSKDGKSWDKAKWIIISTVLTAVLSFILGRMM